MGTQFQYQIYVTGYYAILRSAELILHRMWGKDYALDDNDVEKRKLAGLPHYKKSSYFARHCS
jgi:hypothetical protein